MRIAFGLLSLTLAFSLACQDKKFSGATQTGQAANAEPKDHLQEPTPEVPEPTNEIEFGSDEVFRIGDGNSSAQSACIGEVKSHDLKGTVYYFQFEVLEDDASVDVSIGKFCGVDTAGFTAVALKDEAKQMIGNEISVPTDASAQRENPYAPLSGQKLKKGIYSLVVTSKNTQGRAEKSTDPNVDEYDDFVIGKIQIKSDKTVKQVKVFAE